MRLIKHMAGTTVRDAARMARGIGHRAAPCQKLRPRERPSAPGAARVQCPQSQKSTQLRKIVSEQFRANKHEADPARIHMMKQM
jgi:hypothetical protein